MLNLTTRLCWKFLKKDGYVAMWQKHSNNSCYLNREAGTQPILCDQSDDPDSVWYCVLAFLIPFFIFNYVINAKFTIIFC